MKNRITTRGNVEVQDIQIGDVHYEYEYGICIKSTVQTLPIRNEDGLWKWKSITDDGKTIEYGVHEDYSHYSGNLYDYEAYNAKLI